MKGLTFAVVRQIGLKLPDVEEGTAYGSPALKVRGKMFTCIAIHRSAEPGSLAVRLGGLLKDSDEMVRLAALQAIATLGPAASAAADAVMPLLAPLGPAAPRTQPIALAPPD